MRVSRCSEWSQAAAASALAKRCRITQSTCAGGLGGITVCLMKPGNAATTLLVSSCQRAKASALSGRTRVCVTMVTLPVAAEHSAASPAHGCPASLEKMRSGVNGRCAKRTPVAFASAFAMAGATGLIAHSPCAFAPSGPILS